MVRGIVGDFGWVYYLLGCVCLLFGWFDEVWSLGNCVVEFLLGYYGFVVYVWFLFGDIVIYFDWFDVESGEVYYC